MFTVNNGQVSINATPNFAVALPVNALSLQQVDAIQPKFNLSVPTLSS
jgi:hypothetical protein